MTKKTRTQTGKEIDLVVDRSREVASLNESEIENVRLEIDEDDQRIFELITSDKLTAAQRASLVQVKETFAKESDLLAIHWHPEFVPMELILNRMETMFPSLKRSLVIPTQHNIFMTLGSYAGAEIDCYDPDFNLKIQLLIHMRADRLDHADVLKAMAEHTYTYRAGQLYEFIETILNDKFDEKLNLAAGKTGTDKIMVGFVRAHTAKLKALITENEGHTAPIMLRNKLVRDYFDTLRESVGFEYIDRVQAFLRAVKKQVKASFNFSYFYQAREIIEEARSVGACIIVPHPEQFWPVLLADYDLDGIEVWNPQSRSYTNFLISAVQRLNEHPRRKSRPLLVTMGDDCHMGEKTKAADRQDKAKAKREVGLQTAWNDYAIKKVLGRYNISKRTVIEAYKDRLG